MTYQDDVPHADEVVGSMADRTRDILAKNADRGVRYLDRYWLGTISRSLRAARRRAGLSQAEVAERLHTKQSVIARLEKDREGRFTFRRFIEYANACGVFPYEIELPEFDTIREFALEHPDLPQTAMNVQINRILHRYLRPSAETSSPYSDPLPLEGEVALPPQADQDVPAADSPPAGETAAEGDSVVSPSLALAA